jgi:hypothetical protein
MRKYSVPQIRLAIAAQFPAHFFLENIAVRHDNSLLITVANRRELYYVPPSPKGAEVQPVLLHTFDQLVGGISELERDVFVVLTGNVYTTHDNYVHRLDMRGWKPGSKVEPKVLLSLPKSVLGWNGCCSLSNSTILAADTFGGAIWRVDVDQHGHAQADVWLKHESMDHIKDTLPPPPQPGVNGVRYAAKLKHVYYTTTGQKLLMRVAVEPVDFNPAGEPQRVASGGMYDDFCIDEERGFAYLTVHRENRIDCVPLVPGGDLSSALALAGEPMNDILLGPSSAAWSRSPDELGYVFYVTTDGGQTAPPPDGIVRNAKLLRLELL